MKSLQIATSLPAGSVACIGLSLLSAVQSAAAQQKAAPAAPSTSSSPLSQCPDFIAAPLEAVWCSLTQASPVLQSAQILLLGLLAVAGIARAVYVRKRRRERLIGGAIKKTISHVDKNRLTSLAACTPAGYFVGGFSGDVVQLSSSANVIKAHKGHFGLIRSLCSIPDSDAVLVAGDDGVLHALSPSSSTLKRLCTLGGPIYRIRFAWRNTYLASLGNGEVVFAEIQSSPGQADYSYREIARSKCHNGSAFDVLPTKDGAISVGADGRLITLDRQGQIISSTQIVDHTIWSVVSPSPDQIILACNDGSLRLLRSGTVAKTITIHQGAIRHLAITPKAQWCLSVGKDRSVFAVLADLSDSILLHRTTDYIYQGVFDSVGQLLTICDGAGDVTQIDFGRPLDDLDLVALRARVS